MTAALIVAAIGCTASGALLAHGFFKAVKWIRPKATVRSAPCDDPSCRCSINRKES